MYNKHQVVTVISDAILLDQVAQCNNVCDGSCSEPDLLIIARYRSLLIDQHCSSIGLQTHGVLALVGLVHKGLVAKEVDSGLTVKQYNLPEVEGYLGPMRLFEKL